MGQGVVGGLAAEEEWSSGFMGSWCGVREGWVSQPVNI